MRLVTGFALGIALAAALLGLLATGLTSAWVDALVCKVVSPEYPTVQSAVNDVGCEIVELGEGVFPESVTISRSLTIRGQGMANTAITGAGSGRIITINGDVVVTLDDLAVENGSDGGILVRGGDVHVENSRIANNLTSGHGGGIFVSPTSVYPQVSYARLTVVESIIINNIASEHGGGIANMGADVTLNRSVVLGNEASTGGGIWNTMYEFAPCAGVSGTITVTHSAIGANVATGGGGGIYNHTATLLLQESTVSNNEAAWGGGGLFIYGRETSIERSTLSGNTAFNGAGIFTDYGFSISPHSCSGRTQLTVDNSTLSGNEAIEHGGGIFSGGGGVLISSSTLSENGAEAGGGSIYLNWEADEKCHFGDCTPHAMTMTHSIVANSIRGGECRNDGAAVLGDGGHNIVENGSCISAETSFSGDPLLAGLGFNGGATETHALLAGSPAIDAGANCASTDQRVYLRPADGDGDGTAACDIGAFEFIDFKSLLNLPLVIK